MAAMAVAGGIDNRPHLGGTVKHLTNGIGVVTKITPKGKIYVQFGSRNLKVCRLNELTSVSSNCYLGQKLIGRLVYLSVTGEGYS